MYYEYNTNFTPKTHALKLIIVVIWVLLRNNDELGYISDQQGEGRLLKLVTNVIRRLP